MKYPLWILNLTLLVLFIIVISFIFLSREKSSEIISIKIERNQKTKKGSVYKINLEKIYDNDLFNTYHPEPEPISEPKIVKPIPRIPNPKPIKIPKAQKPAFLAPLQITLKGVMIIKGSENSKAIISNNLSKEEGTYKVGDKIKDAQLIRILKNKVIFIRSNGQQETLFLTEKDAKEDINFPKEGGWNEVAKKITPNKFEVDPEEFTHYIKNLSQLIDLFDLSTAFSNGKNIGCRIGKAEKESLAEALGFNTNDVILKINNIPATTNQNRFSIYKSILTAKTGDIIKVSLIRNNQPIDLSFQLKTLNIAVKHIQKPIAKGKSVTVKPQESPEEVLEEKIQLLKERHKFAPTIKDLKNQERKNMFKKGKQDFLKNFDN